MQNTEITFDSSTLSAFSASLAGLPAEEIRKAKSLFIRNAIADFQAQKQISKGMVWTFGFLSIIPIFLVVFIPTLIGYKAANRATRSKIYNALEVWRDDLGSDYATLNDQLSIT